MTIGGHESHLVCGAPMLDKARVFNEVSRALGSRLRHSTIGYISPTEFGRIAAAS